LQDARAALAGEDYRQVDNITARVTEQVQATLATLDTALRPPTKSRSR
jgi:ribosomal protein S10